MQRQQAQTRHGDGPYWNLGLARTSLWAPFGNAVHEWESTRVSNTVLPESRNVGSLWKLRMVLVYGEVFVGISPKFLQLHEP